LDGSKRGDCETMGFVARSLEDGLYRHPLTGATLSTDEVSEAMSRCDAACAFNIVFDCE